MKRTNNPEWCLDQVLVVLLWDRLATIVPLVVMTTATVTEAIGTEAMTDILLYDMSEYHLFNMSDSFRDADPSYKCFVVIGGGTGSVQEVQAGGGINHTFLIWFHVNSSCT